MNDQEHTVSANGAMPRLRSDLHIEPMGNETVIYDGDRGRVHALNKTASFIAAKCDGVTIVGSVIRELGSRFCGATMDQLTADVVETVSRLYKEDLLENAIDNGYSRTMDSPPNLSTRRPTILAKEVGDNSGVMADELRGVCIMRIPRSQRRSKVIARSIPLPLAALLVVALFSPVTSSYECNGTDQTHGGCFRCPEGVISPNEVKTYPGKGVVKFTAEETKDWDRDQYQISVEDQFVLNWTIGGDTVAAAADQYEITPTCGNLAARGKSRRLLDFLLTDRWTFCT